MLQIRYSWICTIKSYLQSKHPISVLRKKIGVDGNRAGKVNHHLGLQVLSNTYIYIYIYVV